MKRVSPAGLDTGYPPFGLPPGRETYCAQDFGPTRDCTSFRAADSLIHLAPSLPAISFPPVGDADGHVALPAVPRGLRERAEGVGDFRHGSLRDWLNTSPRTGAALDIARAAHWLDIERPAVVAVIPVVGALSAIDAIEGLGSWKTPASNGGIDDLVGRDHNCRVLRATWAAPLVPGPGLQLRTALGAQLHGLLRVFALAAIWRGPALGAAILWPANNGEVAGAWGIDWRLGTQNRPFHIWAQGFALDASDALDSRAHLSGNTLLPLVHGAACLA